MSSFEITLKDVTNYTRIGGENLGEITTNHLPRVGDCLQIMTGDDEWSAHYTVVDVAWICSPSGNLDDERWEKRNNKGVFPCEISVKNNNCAYTGTAGGAHEAPSLTFSDDPKETK